MSRSRVIRLDSIQQFAAINVLTDPGAVGGKVVIPNAVQVVLNWSYADAKTGHNVLYGRSGGIPAPTIAQAQAIFAALSTGAQWTALASFLSQATSFTGVSLRSVHAADQPIISSTGTAVLGTGAGVPLPAEVALVATLRTGLTGPANRGRIYIGGLSVDGLASGNVASAALVLALGNWANTISGALSSQSLTWSIGQQARQAYTGSTGTAHPLRPAGTVPITQAVVRDNHWDSQRRRGLK